MNVWIDGMTVKVRVTSSKAIANKLKFIDGGKWDQNSACWQFPLERYDFLVELRNQCNGHVGLKPIQINSMALLNMETYLVESGYSVRTIRNYIRQLAKFLKYAGGKTDDECIHRYINYLKEEKQVSDAYLRSAKKAVALHLKVETNRLEASNEHLNFAR